MHTIVISTDKPTVDKHFLNNLKRLFPDCKIKIHHKKSDECCENSVIQESRAETKQGKRKK